MAMADLLERRDAILAELEDENTTPDRVTELETEGRSVAEQIERQNAAQKKAAETRASLLRLQPFQAPAPDQTKDDGNRGWMSPGEVRERENNDGGEMETRVDPLVKFIESDRFAEHRSNGYRGKVGFDWPSFVREVRAPIDSGATSGGAFIRPDRSLTVPVTNVDRPLRLADLIDRQNTGSNTVEYVRDTSAAGAGAAAEVAEGAVKPEAPYTFEVVTDTVRTVAHWVQITRQSADDNQQLMGYVRGRLAYGLDFRLDQQIINGNGTSPNLRGILNTTGINLHAPVAAEARVISIRKAVTLCQIDEYAPNTTVLHPSDWELVELSTDTGGMFRVSPNVANALAPRIWGLNVVPTTAIASGTGLVGDFRMGATLWDRQDTQLFLTDSHASTFTSNILTLLAELRAALSVWRPSAFCKITFNGTI